MTNYYNVDDVLRIARRHNNTKRSYLLVNPLQGKHLPVSPIAALNMMKALGNKITEKYSDAKLVIGFAETATAIGAMVSASLSEDCIYIHTTREPISPCIEFLEEHSHAPEQKLYSAKLNEWLANTSTVIFVDDELSTGKTLRNMIRQLKSQYPALNQKHLVAASIINRLTPENEALFHSEGIDCIYLVKVSDIDFDVSDIETTAAQMLSPVEKSTDSVTFNQIKMPKNPRLGVKVAEYINQLSNISSEIFDLVNDYDFHSALVIGTEECMLPAIWIAANLERQGAKTLTHSSTRSPIAISQAPNYPINEGYQLRSFYDTNRITYIYNLNYYDLIIIISDIEQWHPAAVEDLLAALNIHGYGKIIFIGGGSDNVQHI